MTVSGSPSVETARQLRNRQTVDRLTYLRTLRALADMMTQRDLADELRMTQPAVSQALKSAARIDDVRPGFSGGSPYEIAQRYAAGELTRAKAVDELTRWSYDPTPVSDGYDALIVDEPGTHAEDELVRALDDGLIDETIYDQIGEAHRTVK